MKLIDNEVLFDEVACLDKYMASRKLSDVEVDLVLDQFIEWKRTNLTLSFVPNSKKVPRP